MIEPTTVLLVKFKSALSLDEINLVIGETRIEVFNAMQLLR